MAQYDIYRGKPFPLLDMQADLLDGLNTRIAVPLMPAGEAPVAAERLNPAFVLEGERHILVTQYLASVPATLLHSPIARLETEIDQRAAKGAVDFLFDGF